MGRLARLRGVLGVAVRQLRHYRVRTLLAVLGVLLAVVLMTVVGGLGYGLTSTGHEAIDYLNRDLWVSGGPVTFAPGGVGGVDNPIEDAHGLTDRLEREPGVERAQALAFQTVYVSTNTSEFDTVVGVGATGGLSSAGVRAEEFTAGDVHYANGSYEGPMTHEVVVDPQTAARYDLEVGDTLYVGGTIVEARKNAFTVVGVSNTFSRFLAAPTVAVHLSELQEVSGTTGTDGAAIVAVTTTKGTSVRAVERRLERRYPGYEFRTNDEQVRAIVGDQAAVVAAAVTLAVLAVVVGVVLVVNVLALLVHQQRRQLAALKAAGVSSRSLVGVVVWQGLGIGLVGGLLGVAATPPIVDALNRVAETLSGFPNLAKTPPWLLAGAAGLAVVMGLLGSGVAGWRVARLSPLEHLDR